MRELKVKTNEYYPQYKAQIKGYRGRGLTNIEVYLYQDYEKEGDGIYWLMQAGVAILANYPKSMIDNQERLKKEESLIDGEIVLINGKQYKLKMLGDYSDAGIFEEI